MSLIKKKKISKKNKSAWRKTDIQDVEEFLEVKRQDERIGTFAETKDQELFALDVTPLKPKQRVLTERKKRKVNAQKPLRSLEPLENKSKVQDPITKRNHVRQKKSGRIIEEEVRNPTKPRHFIANKDRLNYYEKLEKRLKKENDHLKTAKDIWAEADFRDKIPGLKDEKGWISKDLALHVTNNMGTPVIKVHSSIRHRTTKAKNFQLPHPGTSYNPSLMDHHKLINTVVEREEKIIKQEKHLKRVTTDMFSKVTPEERDERKLKEMNVGLEENENEGDEKQATEHSTNEEMDENNTSYTTVNPPVQNKKKTRQIRNKEQRHKELLKKHEEKKALKKQITDINRIKSLKAEINAEVEELNAKKKQRKKVALKKKFEPKRLGRNKFVEPDADLNMPQDISGNLRNVKPESSLLVNCFKSFQKRNILPTSVAQPTQKKRKVKRFVRNSHKEPGVSFQKLRESKKDLAIKV